MKHRNVPLYCLSLCCVLMMLSALLVPSGCKSKTEKKDNGTETEARTAERAEEETRDDNPEDSDEATNTPSDAAGEHIKAGANGDQPFEGETPVAVEDDGIPKPVGFDRRDLSESGRKWIPDFKGTLIAWVPPDATIEKADKGLAIKGEPFGFALEVHKDRLLAYDVYEQLQNGKHHAPTATLVELESDIYVIYSTETDGELRYHVRVDIAGIADQPASCTTLAEGTTKQNTLLVVTACEAVKASW